MSRITCDCKECIYNFNGVCDKSFVIISEGICQDKESEE